MDLGKLRKMSEYRKCNDCGAEFRSDENLSAMQKYADHSVIHNPTGAQWSEAYEMTRQAMAGKK